MRKIITSALSFTLLFLLSQGVVSASSSSCQVIYGGGQVCPENVSFSVKKEVQKPGTQTYVSDLTINDSKYKPNETVNFKITVKNTGLKEITDLRLTDTLPQFLKYVSGGTVSGRTVSIKVDTLAVAEAKSFNITAKVADASLLPSNQGVVCVTNLATAEVGEKSAEDSAQLCLEKKVLGAVPSPTVVKTNTTAKNIPTTGPQMLPLLGLVASGITGVLLRKKTK